MASPPHPVLHLGMAGWFHIRNLSTPYFKHKEPTTWPPKYWRFLLETEPTDSSPAVEAAYIDFRRFGRVRLVDCPGTSIRQHSPLKENGPDPVIDKDKVSLAWLREKCGSKRIPIKALLLDQANISGIGNWVGDEILFHARVHPEQYCNTLNAKQTEQLHRSLHYVCGLACEVLAESDRFPEDWLFKHRWGKGKKDAANRLRSGEKIVFITVGGRTSAVVPERQKKTGPVARDVKREDLKDEGLKNEGSTDGGEVKASGKAANTKRKRAVMKEESEEEEDVEGEEEEEEEEVEVRPKRAKAAKKVEKKVAPAKNSKKAAAQTPNMAKKEKPKAATAKNADQPSEGRRRSTRLSRG